MRGIKEGEEMPWNEGFRLEKDLSRIHKMVSSKQFERRSPNDCKYELGEILLTGLQK